MRVAAALILLGAVCSAESASESASGREADADFARSNKCMNCHAIDHKVVGPALRDVAARYAGDRNAETRLATKIREGGSGSWGVVPMPANQVDEGAARRLAHWVLMQR